MAEIGYTIAAKLIEVLAHEAIIKICELWGYKSQLEDLQKTVESVGMVLLDADSKWDQLSNQDRHFIGELKDVVYDADDVFDEFRTLAELNQLGKLKKGGKYFDKVRRFFSSDHNQVGHAYRMSRQVKDIKKRLDAISGNYKNFELNVDNKPIVKRDRETCSYIDANEIIGREEDKENIINMLLNSNSSENVSFLSIVGVGGLGKTALAQLVFNDEKIKKEFSDPTYRLWVCVSDQDGEQFDVKTILCKILEVVYGQKFDSTSTMELVKAKIVEELSGKKYFLVLDDVWNENHGKWLNLKKFLMLGKEGSKVVVTTRSKMTATIIGGDGDDRAYMLQGLSEEDSWRLFESTAFASGPKKDNQDELVKIGKNIIVKCYCIPLAIKVVGSLLFGQEISKWRSLEGSGLANIGEGDNGILPILKLSYYNLKPSIKSCFIYCAVFPKDFRIEKEKIIGLWIAQGYVTPLDGGQNLEEAIEEHFSILLRRCFFQDVERDLLGVIESFKIHDLMHDVAQEVGKEEICIVTSSTKKPGDKIRHVSVDDGCLENSLYGRKIRSWFGRKGCFLDAQSNNWMRLRALDLSDCGIESVSEAIGKLLHLRYLDLSENRKLKVLCDSITELYNLQTLDLYGCSRLEELPKGISKLVNLKNLSLYGCDNLICMPSGMNKLTNLRVLPLFVVGFKNNTEKKQSDDVMLEDLKTLIKIQGSIYIKIGKNYRIGEDMNGNEGGYLKSMKYLQALGIGFILSDQFDPFDEDSEYETEDSEDEFEEDDTNSGVADIEHKDEDNWAEHEAMVDKLEPPPGLKCLFLGGYRGKRLGRVEDNWAVSHPLLVMIALYNCDNLEQVHVLSELPHLKDLILCKLNSVVYIVNEMSSESRHCTKVATNFFPSLETLEINHLPKLKGWWKGKALKLRFPRLSKLEIGNCPNLISFAPGANLENMTHRQLSHLLLLKIRRYSEIDLNMVCSHLEEYNLDLISYVPGANPKHMPEYEFPHLRELTINKCPNLVSNLICPSLEELKLKDNSQKLLITCGNCQDEIKSRTARMRRMKKRFYQKSIRSSKGVLLFSKPLKLKGLRI